MSDLVEMDGKFPTRGVGRIRREPYVLHLGDRQIDVDEVRVYLLCHVLRPYLEPLKPLTAQEALWLLNFFGGYSSRDKDFLNLLWELSCDSGNPAPSPEPPSSV